jgi:hypothetical protein
MRYTLFTIPFHAGEERKINVPHQYENCYKLLSKAEVSRSVKRIFCHWSVSSPEELAFDSSSPLSTLPNLIAGRK